MSTKHYKDRVNFQVGASITLDDDEVGSYMMFYIIGKNVRLILEEVISKVGKNRIFDKNCVQALLDMGLHIVVKSGTCANRKSDRWIDPFNIRGREILNELGKCFQGIFEGADLATRKAYNILSSDDSYECQAIMVAYSVHNLDEYTTDIEETVASYVLQKYNLMVENRISQHKSRSTQRWGREEVSIAF